jgi:hypothetical protein
MIGHHLGHRSIAVLAMRMDGAVVAASEIGAGIAFISNPWLGPILKGAMKKIVQNHNSSQ